MTIKFLIMQLKIVDLLTLPLNYLLTMRSLFSLCFALLVVLQLNAQEKAYQFTMNILPEHTYVQEMNISSIMSMKMEVEEGKEEMLEAMEGMDDMNMDMVMNMIVENTTGEAAGDSLPFVMIYKEFDQMMVMNGDTLPSMANPLLDASIEGWYDKSDKLKTHIVSMDGIALPPGTGEQMMASIEGLSGQVNFPDYPLKIGDSFTQKVPFNMPVGNGSGNIELKITYTFKKVAGQKAYFDSVHEMVIDAGIEESDINATTGGTGTMIYDLETGIVVSTTSKMDMVMKMEQPGGFRMNMSGKVFTETGFSVKD